MADKETTTAVAQTGDFTAEIAEHDDNRAFDAILFDDRKFDRMMMIAEVMSKGAATVPKHLAGNQADCMAICMQAASWGMNPYAVAQKTHLVNGTLGYEAQLVNAVITNSGAVIGTPRYEYLGDWSRIENKGQWSPSDEEGLGVKTICTMRDGTDREWTTFMQSCKTRNSPNWKTKPRLQCTYQATKEWARVHAPGVILGVYTEDEIERNAPTQIRTFNDIPEGESQADKLSAMLEDDKGEPVEIKPEEPKTKSKPKKITNAALNKALKTLPEPIDLDIVKNYLVSTGVINIGQMIVDMNDEWKSWIVNNLDDFKDKLTAWM